MPEATILGVNFWIVFAMTIFFCTIAIILFGPGILGNGAVAAVIVFFTIGLTLLISNFSWAILVIPSILVLAATGYLLKRLS